MKHFTELQAWKTGIELMKEIHALSKKFPPDERFGLTQQIRKSSTSILANLAEGFGRFTFPDKAGKFVISRGECYETEAILFIVIELKYISGERALHAFQLIEFERKLLSGLISSCRSRS